MMAPAAAPDRYAVIGHPVAHSRSPFIHARFARQCAQAMQYERLLCPLDGFEAVVRDFASRGGRGCNVTVPFKFDARTLARRCTARAALAGAANVLCLDRGPQGWLADNTDGVGLVRDIECNAGVALAGRSILLIGAGGAAAGALGPLLETHPTRLVVANRTLDRAVALVRVHEPLAATCGTELTASTPADCGGPFDVVINATATSLLGASVPVAASVLGPGTLALDMMYGAAARPFLDWAHAHGATARDGLGMLVEQAAQAFTLWRGVRPRSSEVLDELRHEVDAEARL